MPDPSQVAYDPNDTLQQKFLSALALGETGGSSGAYTEGFGGANLSGTPTDQYGFPTWQGVGSTHAAGAFQFQPATWDQIASQFGLNFQNPQDQNAGAWYYAQQTYAEKSGGKSLEAALSAGDYQSVQSALAGRWPSVIGNMAAPQGLANDLAQGVGASLAGGPSGGSVGQGSGGGTSQDQSQGGVFGFITNIFERFGLIIIGGLIVLVALWQLLSNQGVVPSPGDTAKAVGRTATTLALAA